MQVQSNPHKQKESINSPALLKSPTHKEAIKLILTMHPVIYSSVSDAFKKILASEGITGLYSGFLVSSFGTVYQVYLTTTCIN